MRAGTGNMRVKAAPVSGSGVPAVGVWLVSLQGTVTDERLVPMVAAARLPAVFDIPRKGRP